MGFGVFVMSDVVGSTALWEAHGDGMRSALEYHDRVLESCMSGRGGRVFKHTGDGMIAMFDDPDAAVGAAVGAVDALAGESWGATGPLRIRVSVHAGHVAERDGDCFGPPLNKTARINGIGHSGQVLVSDLVHQLMHSPRGIDLGVHQLRDLSEPVRLWQLDDSDHPPLRTLIKARHNLPAMPTDFVGREAEISELVKLLGQHLLVTVTGVGGCGKTRLVLEVAASCADRFPGGVWFVDLSPERDGTAIGTRTLSALGLTQPIADNDAGPVDALAEATNGSPTLVILDNCEHLIDDVADFADTVLATCPSVTTLATSRETLAIDGEHVWRIPNLRDSATELFFDRAVAAGADADGIGAELDTVDRICRALDDIPLAIELAAAQCASLPLQELAAHLDERFALLGGSRRAGRRRQRQQTLETMMDWSYGLLTEDEQILLDDLAVFPASFTLAGATAVAGSTTVEVRPLLQSLVAQSLVVPPGQTGRYRLLETVRLYALGRLNERDGVRAARDHHLAWVNDICGSQAWTSIDGDAEDRGVLADHEALVIAEIEDVVAAMEWAEECGHHDVLFNLFHGSEMIWAGVRRHARTGLEWLNRIPAPPASDPQSRAIWMSIAGNIHMNLGDTPRAFEYFMEGASLVDELRNGDPTLYSSWAGVVLFRSTMHASLGDYAAAHADADLLMELSYDAHTHKRWLTTMSWMARTITCSISGAPERLDAAEHALASIEGVSLWGEATAHMLVSDALAQRGRHEESLSHARSCLDAEMLGESLRISALASAACAFAALQRPDEALEIITIDPGPILEQQRRLHIQTQLTGLAAVLLSLDNRSKAERLLGIAQLLVDDPYNQVRRRRVVDLLGSEAAVDALPAVTADELDLVRVAGLVEESLAAASEMLEQRGP